MDCLDGLHLIPDGSVDFFLTDPPYEVNYNLKSLALSKWGEARDLQIARDLSFVDSVPNYSKIAFELFRVLKNNSHGYLFCADKQISKWHPALEEAGFKMSQILVWKKNRVTFDLTQGHKYPENKEFILFLQKGWKKLNGYNVERHLFRSVLNFDSGQDTNYHSCSKPSLLLEFLIKASTKKDDVCLDIFMGGGNHILAFQNLERKYIGFELSEVYFNTTLKRLVQQQKQSKIPLFCDNVLSFVEDVAH